MSVINTNVIETENAQTDFQRFLKTVDAGIMGKNEGLPFGFPKLDNYISLRNSMLYVLGGFTGSGKTSVADEMFVLRPMEYLKAQGKLGKLRVIYWSLERKKTFKLARWVSRRIFLETGRLIPMKRILGWVKGSERLTYEEHDLVKECTAYFEELLSYVTIIDGRQNPTGIRKYTEQLAEQHGIIHSVDKFNKVYEPHDPSIIWLHIYDHAGKLKKEQGKTMKEVIDDFSDDVSNITRDLYGHSGVVLSQFNRSISNPMRLKEGDVEPRLEDFKDTGDLPEDADFVCSLFDPWRYKVPDPIGYDLTKFRDGEGAKKYRSFNVLKNSFGAEGIRLGLAYQPQTGIFTELPHHQKMTLQDYAAVVDDSYFLHDDWLRMVA